MDNEIGLVKEFAEKLNTQLLYFLPRDNVVQRAECRRKTVIEFEPSAAQAEEYRSLAKRIAENRSYSVPTPLGMEELEALLEKYMTTDNEML